MHKIILKIIKESDSDYEIGLKTSDLQLLKKCLEFCHKWSLFLKKIENHAIKFSEKDDNLKLMNNYLSKFKFYDARKEDIKKNLFKSRDVILQISLLNSETVNFEKERDFFFERIHSTINFLSMAKCLQKYDLVIDFNLIEDTCLNSLKTKIKLMVDETQNLVDKLTKEETLNKTDYSKLNNNYSILISILKKLINFLVRIKMFYID